MKATVSGPQVRVETGITPATVADLFRDWTNACLEAQNYSVQGRAGQTMREHWENLADSYARDLHDALNPTLTVGQARAFGWDVVNAATSAAREAWDEEGTVA